MDRSLEQAAREAELRNEPWNDIFFLWALIWAMNIPFYKPKMSRFLKDRLRTQDNLLVWAVPAVCPVSRPGKASLWGGEDTLCRGKTSRVEGLKALELLERKGHTYLWNKGKRCCGVLMCNWPSSLWRNYSLFRTICICWFGKLCSQSNSYSLPMVMPCYFLSCSTFRSCCKGKLYVEPIVITSRTQPCDIPFPFGPFKKVICASFRHGLDVFWKEELFPRILLNHTDGEEFAVNVHQIIIVSYSLSEALNPKFHSHSYQKD